MQRPVEGVCESPLCVESREPVSRDPCRKCGRCCTIKLVIDGEAVATPFLCPHLDERTSLCRIYEQRYELNPLCTSPELGVRLGIWPGDCPHAEGVPGYVPPRDATREELEAFGESCRAAQDEIRKVAEQLLPHTHVDAACP
jgi:hypothetical protein